jgi:SulP family sulfate permease
LKVKIKQNKGRGANLNLSKIKYSWFGNIKGDVLAGIVVALALVP